MAKKSDQPADVAETVILHHPDGADGVLSVGEVDYVVEAGAVAVAVEHVDAALQAGFRPAGQA